MNQDQIKEFLNRLESPEGCNFREEVKGKPESIVWNCDSDYKHSRRILTKMSIPKAEQDGFLERCGEHGGHCDCEILFNAEEHLLEDGL